MVVLAYLKRDLANELDKNNDGKIDSSEAAGQGQGYLDMLGSQFAARGAVPPGAAPAATGRATARFTATRRAYLALRFLLLGRRVSQPRRDQPQLEGLHWRLRH